MSIKLFHTKYSVHENVRVERAHDSSIQRSQN